MRLAPFLDRIEECLPGWPENVPPAWQHLRLMTEARVAQGDEMYGSRYRTRDNVADALEECADLLAYSCFTTIVHGDEDIDLALTAAYHSYQAAAALLHLRDKGHGAP